MTHDVTTTRTPGQTEHALAELLSELLGGPADRYSPDTELFGSLPELDSLALVELITMIEERFRFEMDEDDITIEVFGTVAALAAHIDSCTT